MSLAVDDPLLRAWPLPQPDADADKEDRGRVLVLAGSREMPGAAILAATAALRAGAGKLVIATPQSVATPVAAAVPEARVIALPEGSEGAPTLFGLPALQAVASSLGAVVIGPGMIGPQSTIAFVQAVLPLFRQAVVVLDALAMDLVKLTPRFAQPVILTPHAGEMAHLTGAAKEDLQEEPQSCAGRHAAAWNAVVALKGATTCVATPDGRSWTHRSQAPGLATSGSGDVLAGLIAGLAARGCAPEQAAVWGVALHARAGQALAQQHGTLGYLARELPAQVPALMNALHAG
ncbi:NAD(P)H-hydrate dehydratase [Ramlibacter alkalitolerans]|uniref:ADP-dependent (S)-NAD(P)H-hydrate dehydratase n=1 Tax=Ramlibacter alkalitolerans TaxID=2039631 RepID=A0ABS1JWC5_9BURK|nr:NAD(P)H-hydrate dehydratase [Ramlibacter alkalitolerans]MBL0428614.1 NAD(P)H-hydrate dehydratase [Ramlibacter alkalitolerans]